MERTSMCEVVFFVCFAFCFFLGGYLCVHVWCVVCLFACVWFLLVFFYPPFSAYIWQDKLSSPNTKIEELLVHQPF